MSVNIRHRLRFSNAVRSSGGEYSADIVLDGNVVGTVSRPGSRKGGGFGYRSNDYRARIDGRIVATGSTVAEVRDELRMIAAEEEA